MPLACENRSDCHRNHNHAIDADAEFRQSSSIFLADLPSVSITGLETWFDLSYHGEPQVIIPRPNYKMAVIKWRALYFAVVPRLSWLFRFWLVSSP